MYFRSWWLVLSHSIQYSYPFVLPQSLQVLCHELPTRKVVIVHWCSSCKGRHHGRWYCCMVHCVGRVSRPTVIIHCLNVFSFLTVAATFGYTNSFGVYQDLYTRSNTASASAVSWIGSTQIFFLLAMALPGGKLLDMGYFRTTTLVGSLIYAFSWIISSIHLLRLPTAISGCSCCPYVIQTNSTNYIFRRDWGWE